MCDPTDETIGDCSLDEALRGRLRLWQPAKGYRFSVDAFLLADFARAALPKGAGRLVDLGAGCGVVGLALALAGEAPDLAVTLVELQPRLAALCRRNAQENGLAERVDILEGDLRQLKGRLPGAEADLVVSNPPFQPAHSGKVSPDPEKALANTECESTLPDLVQSAARLLRPGGGLAVIYPGARLPELFGALAAQSLSPVRLRAVYPQPGRPAKRILVQARKGGGVALVIEPPLTIHQTTGVYMPEAACILGDG